MTTTTPNTDDWPTTLAKFADLFGPHRTRKRTNLEGVNFMTDEILGVVEVAGEPVEISTGWFMDHRIFGVTFPPTVDGQADERSHLVSSLEQAYAELFGGDDV